MSVTIRPYKRGGWEVDIRVVFPDGTVRRDRRKAPVDSKSGALRWGRDREREILLHPQTKTRKEVPTLSEFAPRFLDGYARANRQKPSGIASKETILNVHLIPFFGGKRLNEIGNEDVQLLKSRLIRKAPKTVNNVLTVLNTMMRVAVEWEVIDQMPYAVRLLKVPQHEAAFHDSDVYERLIKAAGTVDPRALLIVLLGGDAGLRCGEMMALRCTDIDFTTGYLQVAQSEWKGKVTTPKGGRPRRVPMTKRLMTALQTHRHLRGSRVLSDKDGQPLTQKMVQNFVRGAARIANIENGGVHILRHTFCSLLAMRGAAPRAIQELAGHKDLSTTQRYMHLTPAAIEAAIKLLETPTPAPLFGDIVETGTEQIPKRMNQN